MTTYTAIIEDFFRNLWLVRSSAFARCFAGVEVRRCKDGGFEREDGWRGSQERLVLRDRTRLVAFF